MADENFVVCFSVVKELIKYLSSLPNYSIIHILYFVATPSLFACSASRAEIGKDIQFS